MSGLSSEKSRSGRFEVLDGLRGLCALVVVGLHFCEALRCDEIIPHSHLAVEYFFFLTGLMFVLAYDPRWAAGKLTLPGFLWRRFVRLWPLVLIGSFVGLLFCFILDGDFSGRLPHEPKAALTAFLASLTMWPQTKGFMTPLQPQTWTLLYIVYANVLYALVLRHLKTWMLYPAVAAALWFSWHVATKYGSFALGWDFKDPHITVACARMAFPVLAGMLLARLRWKLSFPGAGVVAMLLLAFVLCAPVCGARGITFGRYEFFMVTCALPLVILCGAGSAAPTGRLTAFCRFLGKYSFPLYATHFPFRIVLGTWVKNHPHATTLETSAAVFAFSVFALAVAWLAMKAVDALPYPFRRPSIVLCS